MAVNVDTGTNLRGRAYSATVGSDNTSLVSNEQAPSGHREDGTGDSPLRPVIYEGDVSHLFTINGAVVNLILGEQNKYNKEVYSTLMSLDLARILPHISVTDETSEDNKRLVVTEGHIQDGIIILHCMEYLGEEGNYAVYKIVLNGNGIYNKTVHNAASGFLMVGDDGTLWDWDDTTQQYISTGIGIFGKVFHIEVFSANGSQFMRAGAECDMFAEVWNNDIDITEQIPQSAFSWQRSSGDIFLDNIWNQRHENYGSLVHIGQVDVNKSCTFYCLIPLEVLRNLNT